MIEQYFQLKYMQEMTAIILGLGILVISTLALVIAFIYVIHKTKKK